MSTTGVDKDIQSRTLACPQMPLSLGTIWALDSVGPMKGESDEGAEWWGASSNGGVEQGLQLFWTPISRVAYVILRA